MLSSILHAVLSFSRISILKKYFVDELPRRFCMKSSFKASLTLSARRTSAVPGAPEAREKSLSLVWCSPRIFKIWYYCHNLLDSPFLFLTWPASRSLCSPAVGHSRSLIRPQTSSIFSKKTWLWKILCAYNINIQQSCKATHAIHLYKIKIYSNITLYCGVIMEFNFMAIVGNFKG